MTVLSGALTGIRDTQLVIQSSSPSNSSESSDTFHSPSPAFLPRILIFLRSSKLTRRFKSSKRVNPNWKNRKSSVLWALSSRKRFYATSKLGSELSQFGSCVKTLTRAWDQWLAMAGYNRGCKILGCFKKKLGECAPFAWYRYTFWLNRGPVDGSRSVPFPEGGRGREKLGASWRGVELKFHFTKNRCLQALL